MKKMNGTKKTAYGGILTAIAVVLLIVSGILPKGRFFLPLAAGLAVFAAAREFSNGFGVMIYVAVSLLSFLVCADKTGVLCFVLIFGYYPLIKRKIEYIKNGVLSWGLKFILFTAVFAAFILMNKFVFGTDLTAISPFGIDFSNFSFLGVSVNTPLMLCLLLYLAFLIFMFVYDCFLAKFYPFYDFKIHPHLPL
ncbi:MAG: hypothetical protein ACI4M3_08070 [Acutalibacteraceae bacterium]